VYSPLRYQKQINEKVTLVLESQNSFSGFKGSSRLLGTVRYQFSPRLVAAVGSLFLLSGVLVTASLMVFFGRLQVTLNPGFPSTKLEAHYEDSDNIINVKTILTPLLLATTPPTTISLSRRLFRSKPHRGKIDLHLGKQPSFSLFYVSPPTVDLPEDEGPSFLRKGPPSTYGFKYIAFERTFGLMFDAIVPRLFAEASLIFVELSARVKASIQFGPAQLLFILGASWSNETASISSDLILNPTALILRLEYVNFFLPCFYDFYSDDAVSRTLNSNYPCPLFCLLASPHCYPLVQSLYQPLPPFLCITSALSLVARPKELRKYLLI